MVWILITTFMVVVGTGHCTDAAAAHIDQHSSSECQLIKAGSQHAKSSIEKLSYSSEIPAPALTAPDLLLNEVFTVNGIANSRALGSSLLADMRFSGTSPPVT